MLGEKVFFYQMETKKSFLFYSEHINHIVVTDKPITSIRKMYEVNYEVTDISEISKTVRGCMKVWQEAGYEIKFHFETYDFYDGK